MKAFDESHDDGLSDALNGVPAQEQAELREIWCLAGGGDEVPPFSEAARQALWAAVAPRPARTGSPDRAPVARTRPRMARQAGVAIVVLVALVGYLNRYRLVETGPGERIAVDLPDGSRVELNSGTSIRYPRWFLGGRRVQLAGEAFFDIAENPASLFVVTTFNARIEVLGTRFNVRAYPDGLEASTLVALETGRVELSVPGKPEARRTLSPGETRRVEARSGAIREAPDATVEIAMAWLRGDLLFRNQTLRAVLEEIARRYAVELSLQPATLMEKQVTFSFHRPEGVEQVLESLCAALGLTYSETAGGYRIYDAASI